MASKIKAPSSPEIITAEWNRNARVCLRRHRTQRGTQDFMDYVLNDVMLGNKTAVVSSFGIESAVPLALVAKINPATPVIFLDPGHTHRGVLEYRDMLTNHFRLSDVRTITATPEQFASYNPYGKPPTCCGTVKKEMLADALKDFSVWISGRKRYQGDTRANIPMAEASQGKIKINPMALWSEVHVTNFIRKNNIPEHPLVAEGFGSVGCDSCTIPGPGRSGRWPGAGKTECGIHDLYIDGGGI